GTGGTDAPSQSSQDLCHRAGSMAAVVDWGTDQGSRLRFVPGQFVSTGANPILPAGGFRVVESLHRTSGALYREGKLRTGQCPLVRESTGLRLGHRPDRSFGAFERAGSGATFKDDYVQRAESGIRSLPGSRIDHQPARKLA